MTATGRDALVAGRQLYADCGCPGPAASRRSGAFSSRRHITRPQYNGLKFFQPGGMVLSPDQGRALLDRWQRKDFAWASWDSLGRTSPDRRPRRVPSEASARDRRCRGHPPPAIRRGVGCLPRCRGAARGPTASRPWDAGPSSLGVSPMAITITCLSRPRRTCSRSLLWFRRSEPLSGLRRTPTPTGWLSSMRSGHYIGEELTLALAALRRLDQIQGPVVLNLSTSKVTEELARKFGCRVLRTPVGEINVVNGMLAENAVLGGEGNGGVIDPRVGLRARQLRRYGAGARSAGHCRIGPCRAGLRACLGW